MSSSYPQKRNLCSNEEFIYQQKQSNFSNFPSLPICSSSSNNQSQNQSQHDQKQQFFISVKIKQAISKVTTSHQKDPITLAKIDQLLDALKTINLGICFSNQTTDNCIQAYQQLNISRTKAQSLKVLQKNFIKRLNLITEQRLSNLKKNYIIYEYDENSVFQLHKSKFIPTLLQEQFNEFQIKTHIASQQNKNLEDLAQRLTKKIANRGVNIQQNQFAANISNIFQIENQDSKQQLIKRQKDIKICLSEILKESSANINHLKNKNKQIKKKNNSQQINIQLQFAKNSGLNKALFNVSMPFKVKQSLKQLQEQRNRVFSS